MVERTGHALFVREFFRHPVRTASLVPSSPALAERMADVVPATGHPVVVELGPGTGAFTHALQERLGGRGRHVAIDLNPRMTGHLARRFPGVEVVEDSADALPRILAERGTGPADLVVSGLPFTVFETGERPLVETIASVLAPDGAYTQFSYSWTRWAAPARRQRARVRASFAHVETGRTVWRNFPPAFVYVASGPRSSAEVTAAAPTSTSAPAPAAAGVLPL
ncbi:class I SAM-dependent methyltransferase [Streptomyces avicenniae]|uniref:class I SAM-dependent methyltransferase n=1 Tax=Streptomyces avicenniae TaxID=500153 RepID=UPI000DA63672|nr:methyltransferase domain-containing protein [Streptomyces avicenniae]